MKYSALFAAVFFICMPALAQNISITTVCSELANYKPAEGTEFKPGVDVNGKAVAPADIDKPVQAIAYPIQIPIEIDILRLLDIDVPPEVDTSNTDATVAYLTVQENGTVQYNGQDISSEVSHVCKDKLEDVPVAIPAAAPATTAPSVSEQKPVAPPVPAIPAPDTTPAQLATPQEGTIP